MTELIKPEINFPETITFRKASTTRLSNGTEIHYINDDATELVRIQFVFDAGSSYSSLPLVASSVAHLIDSGTSRSNAFDISTFIETEGAFFSGSVDADQTTYTLHCLSDKLEKVLPKVHELLFDSVFPEEEVEDHLMISRQNFKVNQQRVAFLAKNEFLNLLLGSTHPYANKIEASHFDGLKREQLLKFYQSTIVSGKFEIFAAGAIKEEVLALIERTFGESRNTAEIEAPRIDLEWRKNPEDLNLELDWAKQSALRIGKPIISKSHEDYSKLLFTNTLLGGFFGSRLMMNLREDKGYTYGIGSTIISLRKMSYFLIAGEVQKDAKNLAHLEIKKEIERLSSSTIAESEIELVRNYLKGAMMRSFDGVFSAMDRFRALKKLDLNYDYYARLQHDLNMINSKQLNTVAQKYLNYESLFKITIG